MIPHHSAAIFVREGDLLKPVHTMAEEECWHPLTSMTVGEGLSGWAAENHQPIVNGNPAVEPGYYSAGRPLLSAISVPLEANGDVTGLVTLYSAHANAFTQDHLRVLQQISPKAGMALANALQHEKTAASAATDELTGLPNTRSLMANFEARLRDAKENGSSGAVIVLDLDGFKAVNDNFGHLTGNRVLCQVSEALQQVFSDRDYAARMGGDEFVVLMREYSQVYPAIERLDSLVQKIGQQTCGTEELSVSAGAAFYPVDGDTPERLLAVADERMYRMKEQHRFPAPLPTLKNHFSEGVSLAAHGI